jgi:toxin ParE1/3/4
MQVVLRPAAREDARSIITLYKQTAGRSIALPFQSRVAAAFYLISENPSAGSARLGTLAGLPDLWMLTVSDYPHLIFYLELPHRIEEFCALHFARHIPATLQG